MEVKNLRDVKEGYCFSCEKITSMSYERPALGESEMIEFPNLKDFHLYSCSCGEVQGYRS